MKHSIRYHVVDPIVGKRVKVETVNGELGSGILDKNGKEIFENDRVTWTKHAVTNCVDFQHGAFYLDSYPLHDLKSGELEIIGHGDD